MKKNIFILILGIIIASCDSYLDDVPSKSENLPLKTIEQLDALLGNYDKFYKDINRYSIYGTNDWSVDLDFYKDGAFGSMSSAVDIAQVATWDREYCVNDAKDGFWGSEYNKIFHANMVLHYLDKVSGDKETKERLKGEAHLIKAYSYWNLVNTYCKLNTPANKESFGLTIKNSVSFEENISRSTLEETYKEIEKNLNEALNLKSNLFRKADGKYLPWRGSLQGAKAFAARYYLSVNNYQKALDYAEEALNDYSELINYREEYSFDTAETTVVIDGKEQQVDVDYPYTYRGTYSDMLNHKEFYYARYSNCVNGWFLPSDELLNLYDQAHDLRFKYHFVDNYSLTKNKDYSLKRFATYMHYGSYDIPSGPTTSEMMLIKAECMARLGSWEKAMDVLSEFRKSRFDEDQYAVVSAKNKEEAISLILIERRLERPFVFTWYDYRRFMTNENPNDDVKLSREFYNYSASSIEEGTKNYELKHWACPVPYTEIEVSEGVIEQNQY